MKKISILMLGIVIGIGLAITSSVYADDIQSLIGKTIQGEFPVKIDGKTLGKKAVVIDGSSYLPVRIIGDATGYDVTFDAELGVKLTKKAGVNVVSAPGTIETKEEIQARYDKTEAEAKIEREKQENIGKASTISGQISNKENTLKYWGKKLKDFTDPIVNDENKKALGDQKYNETITSYQTEIDKVQAELDDLNKQLAALNISPTSSPTPTP
jgi:outer membrane translocation and assembly module TamA